VLIQTGQTVLFQGDSITDCGRPRDDSDSHLGLGYPSLIAAQLPFRQPQLEITFVNRGVGGGRVPSLQERWQGDCIDLKPDWVSILIGINDACAIAGDDLPGYDVDGYEAGYRDILTQVRDETGARLIILEPFLLHTEHPYDFISPIAKIRQALDPIIQVARTLGAEFDAITVPLDDMFQETSKDVDPAHWAADAIHPTPAGHAFIANAWLKAVGAM